MKRASILFIIVLAINLAFAGNINENTPETAAATTTSSVKGNVVDFKSGESLVGAVIKIEGTDLVSYTDLDGNFEIKNLKPGTYNLVVSYISYKNSLLENYKITATVGKPIEVQLIPENN